MQGIDEVGPTVGDKKKGKKPFDNGEKGAGPRPKDLHQVPKFNQYTPFNAPRAKIIEEALSTELLPPVKKKPTPSNADGKKHCQ